MPFLRRPSAGPQDLTHSGLMAIGRLAHETLLDSYKDQPPARLREDGREVWSDFEVIDDIITDAERLLAYGSPDRRREADGLMRRLVDVDAMLSATRQYMVRRSGVTSA